MIVSGIQENFVKNSIDFYHICSVFTQRGAFSLNVFKNGCVNNFFLFTFQWITLLTKAVVVIYTFEIFLRKHRNILLVSTVASLDLDQVLLRQLMETRRTIKFVTDVLFPADLPELHPPLILSVAN